LSGQASSIQWQGKLVLREHGNQFLGSMPTVKRRNQAKKAIPVSRRTRAQLSTKHQAGSYLMTVNQSRSQMGLKQEDLKCGVLVTLTSIKFLKLNEYG
jgi:ribosome-binding protein aMBF1 (putative translation factor)